MVQCVFLWTDGRYSISSTFSPSKELLLFPCPSIQTTSRLSLTVPSLSETSEPGISACSFWLSHVQMFESSIAGENRGFPKARQHQNSRISLDDRSALPSGCRLSGRLAQSLRLQPHTGKLRIKADYVTSMHDKFY